MNKQVIKITIIFVFLVLGLFFGLPVEFLNKTAEKISSIILPILIILLFVQLARLIRSTDRKSIRIVTIIVTTIVAIPYIFIGIMTTILVTSSHDSSWEDIAIYTKPDGRKVISQRREISGSIYDYGSRKIFAELGQLRISIPIDDRKMKGLWTEHLIKKDSTFTINLDKNIVDYYDHIK